MNISLTIELFMYQYLNLIIGISLMVLGFIPFVLSCLKEIKINNTMKKFKEGDKVKPSIFKATRTATVIGYEDDKVRIRYDNGSTAKVSDKLLKRA